MNVEDLEILKENLKTFLQVFIGKEAENFFNSFVYFYQKLGDDSKIFFERLLYEAENVKNGGNLKEEDFITLFKEELENLSQNTQNQTWPTESTQEKEKTNTEDLLPKKEESNKPIKLFVLPMDWQNFQLNIDMLTKDFLQKNIDDLKSINIYKEKDFLGTSIGVYAKNNLLPEEKIKEFQKQYAEKYLEKLSEKMGIKLEFKAFNAQNDIILQSHTHLNQIDFISLVKNVHSHNNLTETKNLNFKLDMNQIKEFHQNSKEFIDTFENETKEVEKSNKISNENSKIEQNEQKIPLNSNRETPQYCSLLDFFEKKRIENQNLSISKDEFKKDFLEYCKTHMNEQEMQTLISLYNKTPTKLTKEHKEMIEKGMRYNLINNNLLDKDLKASLEKVLNKSLENKEISQITNKIASEKNETKNRKR